MANLSNSKVQKQRETPYVQEATGGTMRLQKVLAAAGIGSRRQCEQLIRDGRVEVEGQVVTELGSRVDPMGQEIRVDGELVPRRKRAYFLVNKPVGVVSTSRDPSGRLRVIDLVETNERLFTVGRLDKSSEGLILVTNDGELANRLMHPRYGVPRTYQVVLAGHPTRETFEKLRRGIQLADGVVRVDRLRVTQRHKQSTTVEMVLTEGRNREIRRMAARLGHKVMKLRRVGFGPLRLGQLPPGAYRPLTAEELRQLRSLYPAAARQPRGTAVKLQAGRSRRPSPGRARKSRR